LRGNVSDNGETKQSTQIPAHAINPAVEGDPVVPVGSLLRSVNLLGPEGEEDGLAATLEGSSMGVAVIESTATALAKWWATGGSAALVAVWVWAARYWPNQDPVTKRTIILSVAIFSAAMVLALGHLLSSDVRGRAVASAATFRARADIVDCVVRASLPDATNRAIPLPQLFHVGWSKGGDTRRDWVLLAVEGNAETDGLRFLIQRDTRHEWVSATELSF